MYCGHITGLQKIIYIQFGKRDGLERLYRGSFRTYKELLNILRQEENDSRNAGTIQRHTRTATLYLMRVYRYSEIISAVNAHWQARKIYHKE